jgi:hypothetical protein
MADFIFFASLTLQEAIDIGDAGEHAY